MKKPEFTWTYSKLSTFEQCPRKYHHLNVLKDVAENFDTPQIKYGNEFHASAEHYIGDGWPLDPRFEFARKALDKLNAMEGEKFCEYRMALNEDLEPVEYFAKDVWWRGVIDLAIVNGHKAKIIDYKTGSFNPAYVDKGQLELMAIALIKHMPQITHIQAGLLYVVANAFVRDTYTMDNVPYLWAKWLAKYGSLKKAYKLGVWNPKSSGLCKAHCVVFDCHHNGRSN